MAFGAYIKSVGKNLSLGNATEHTHRAALPNLILTDYLEFRHYVNGEHRATARIAEEGDGELRPGAGELSESPSRKKHGMTEASTSGVAWRRRIGT